MRARANSFAAAVCIAISACALTLAACKGDDDSSERDAAANGGQGADKDAGSDAGSASGSKAVWSHMGFDSKNNYFNPAEKKLSVANAAQLQEKWVFTVGGFGTGTPIVGEGKVFITATAGIYAVDLETGEQVWFRTGIGTSSSPAYEPGFVYVHDGAANLWKLNASDGKTVWGPVRTYERAGCDGTSSPVIADDKVIVGHACGPVEVSSNPKGARGGVEAFEREDGSRAWTYITVTDPEDGAMVWSTVAVDVVSKAVYATTGNNYTSGGANSDSFHAIDLDTGKRLWKRQVRTDDTWSLYSASGGPDTDFGANPIIADIGGMAMVSAGDKAATFWAIDRITGATIWSHPDLTDSHGPTHGGVLNNGAFDGKYLYCVSNDPASHSSVLHALDPVDMGKSVWSRMFPANVSWGAPSLANGLLLVPIDSKLYVLDAKDGTDIKVIDTGGTIAGGAAAIVDGKVIVKSGLQYAFEKTVKNNNKIYAYALP